MPLARVAEARFASQVRFVMLDSEDQDTGSLPDELPPVQPPSAGFILQLFVVPGLIVLAVVAVWALFGRMASSEQDWQSLVVELQNPNQHRRWRGANGLAQMLKADQTASATGQKLSDNPDVAKSLASVLSDELKRGGQTDEDIKYEAFLARTLGLFNLPEIVLPALQTAIKPEYDREVRKNALGSISLLADRQTEHGTPLKQPALVEGLLEVSRESDPLIRQLAAFTLGLFPDAPSRKRLVEMLQDADFNARCNAAIGLARQKDPAAFPVLVQILQSATTPDIAKDAAGSDATAKNSAMEARFESFVAAKNGITAIEQLAPEFTPEQRKELIALLEPIAADYGEPQVKMAAKGALQLLQKLQ